MNPKLKPIMLIYNVNTILFINSFADVSESDSLKRPNKKTNSMMFIALHVLDARCFMLSQMGAPTKNPFAKYVDWAKTIDEIKTYPKLKKVLSEWKKIDIIFMEEFKNLTPKKLEMKQQFDFLGGKKIINMISFLAQHEAYHVGQIALIRKFLGYPATSY